MGQESQSVAVFAELGVSLAGFALVGSVLATRSESDHPALDALRMMNLVVVSAALILGGLLPMVISTFVDSSDITIKISSGLL